MAEKGGAHLLVQIKEEPESSTEQSSNISDVMHMHVSFPVRVQEYYITCLVKEVKCRICDLPSHDKLAFKEHFMGIHLNSLKRPKKWKSYRCEICSAMIKRIVELDNHLKLEHKGRGSLTYRSYPVATIQCDMCDREFTFYDDFVRHISDQHLKDLCDEVESVYFRCIICLQKYKNREETEEHVMKKHVELLSIKHEVKEFSGDKTESEVSLSEPYCQPKTEHNSPLPNNKLGISNDSLPVNANCILKSDQLRDNQEVSNQAGPSPALPEVTKCRLQPVADRAIINALVSGDPSHKVQQNDNQPVMNNKDHEITGSENQQVTEIKQSEALQTISEVASGSANDRTSLYNSGPATGADGKSLKIAGEDFCIYEVNSDYEGNEADDVNGESLTQEAESISGDESLTEEESIANDKSFIQEEKVMNDDPVTQEVNCKVSNWIKLAQSKEETYPEFPGHSSIYTASTSENSKNKKVNAKRQGLKRKLTSSGITSGNLKNAKGNTKRKGQKRKLISSDSTAGNIVNKKGKVKRQGQRSKLIISKTHERGPSKPKKRTTERGVTILRTRGQTGCRYCLYQADSKKSLEKHRKQHHTVHPYRCVFYSCFYKCARQEDAVEHFRKKHCSNENLFQILIPELCFPAYQFQCDVCRQRFIDEKELQQHWKGRTKHRPYKDSSTGITSTIITYDCCLCLKYFAKRSLLKEHFQVHYCKPKFMCSVCGDRFNRPACVRAHRDIHPGTHPERCKDCLAVLPFTVEHSKHSEVCTGTGPCLTCFVCGKVFDSRKLLHRHVRADHYQPPKIHKCSICDAKFAVRHELRDHLKKHPRERPYICNLCSKSFLSQGQLTAHEFVHETHACKTCTEACKGNQKRKVELHRLHCLSNYIASNKTSS